MKKLYPILLLSFVLSSPVFAQERTEKYVCYFALNEAALPVDSLAKFRAWLRQKPLQDLLSVKLTGYTDTLGTRAKNRLLAQKRVETVEKAMSGLGWKIDGSMAAGEDYDLSGYTINPHYRKVEIVLSYREAPEGNKTGNSILEERMEKFEHAEVEPISLNIQFVGGQDVYIGDSYLEVAALLQYLKKYPGKKAFIRGHVCCQNDMELSVRRAYAVYNDLILEGISPDRLTYKGFGNTMPLVQETDEFARQMNRRVDVIFSE